MNNLNQLFDLLAKALLGAHPKSSWGGYAIAGLLIAWQVWVSYNGGTADPVIITAAIGIAFGGRAMNPTKPEDPPNGSGPGGPSRLAGRAPLWGILLTALLGLLAAVLLSGCSMTGLGGASTFEKVQGGVDTIVPDWAQGGLEWLRTSEGQAYARKRGLISTNGAAATLRVWDVAGNRWLDGQAVPVQTITITLPPIGTSPGASPPPFSPSIPTNDLLERLLSLTNEPAIPATP
jgi:hypothetical protein